MNEHVKTFTAENFDTEVLQSSLPVLVDVWAEWCGPCKRLGPVIDETAPEYAGEFIIGKLNADEHGSTCAEYGIRSIPTLLIFKDGKVTATAVGGKTKAELKAFIDANK